MSVVDNSARNRFELIENGHTAFADYRRQQNTLVVPHVEAPIALRGTGAAGRLMAGMLDLMRSRGEKIVPVCPYAVDYLNKHPEYQDLIG